MASNCGGGVHGKGRALMLFPNASLSTVHTTAIAANRTSPVTSEVHNLLPHLLALAPFPLTLLTFLP